MGDAEDLLVEARRLLAASQWKSAAFIAGVVTSRLAAQMRGPGAGHCGGTYVDALVACGDAFMGNGECRRALGHYSSALTVLKSGRRLVTLSPPKSATPESLLRTKIAQAYLKLNDHAKALEHLEKVDVGSNSQLEANTTLFVLMAKANCYRRRGSREPAADTYRAALHLNPFCVEAIAGLLEVTPTQMEQTSSAVKRVYNRSQCDWLHKWVDVLKCKCQGDFQEALRTAQALLQEVGDHNTSVLLEVAECQYRLASLQESAAAFEKVRVEDCFVTEKMDVYASLLRQTAGLRELNQLAHSLLVTNPQAAEAWVTLALLSDRKGRRETAHSFVDKATEVNPQHVRAHLLKGQLLNADQKVGQAIKSYRKAYQLSRDLVVYQGLVESYLLNQQPLDASLMANEATDLYPSQPQAWVLAGNVYCHSKQLAKARKMYDEALTLRPDSFEAVLSMVDLDCLEGRWNDGVARLKRLVPQHKFFHTRLADIYLQRKEFGEAVFHYNAALRDNPNNPAAAAGLKRAEKWMNGLDPSEDDADDLEEDDLVSD
eukprot:GGOE01014661.1.p1 GENE.GGOE01014661.1~~GGOE01014661.1.p1  ORF type:complete len:554 (-),score=177.65 GGOE01014661.1:223-1854(-)